MHKKSLFIFRRDLRLNDNTALLKASIESDKVIPLFIFTPKQIVNNIYKSSNAIQFMIESLYDLDSQIKTVSGSRLWVEFGDEIEVIQKIYKLTGFTAIYLNKDYTPYATKRDNRIRRFCSNHTIDYKSCHDILLAKKDVYANNGNPYHVFNLFYNKATKQPVDSPKRKKIENLMSPPSSIPTLKKLDTFFLEEGYYEINDNIAVHGGRKNALKILKKIDYQNYNENHDYPEFHTSMMSAHNKFGTVSIREVFQYFQKDTSGEMCRKLYWRDFYYYVGRHFIGDFFRDRHITKPHKDFKWENNKKLLKKWKDGKTGFPIVDAAMRELNTTGFMHNRCRMIVSEFLVKDLLIDWKYGERYFSTKLVDIDRIQNTGNWNWSASFGLDSSPYLRIFNPWTQAEKYDPQCEYIKRWIPELSELDNRQIHKWEKYYKKHPDIKYPEPIVDHSKQRKKFIALYKKIY